VGPGVGPGVAHGMGAVVGPAGSPVVCLGVGPGVDLWALV
jgi:hypothetical protein